MGRRSYRGSSANRPPRPGTRGRSRRCAAPPRRRTRHRAAGDTVTVRGPPGRSRSSPGRPSPQAWTAQPGPRSSSFQFLDAQVAEAHFEGLLALADLVDLQADEPRRRDAVLEVGGGDAVEPGLDRVAIALDAEL